MSLLRTFTVILVAVIMSFLLMASAAHLLLKPVDLAGEMQNASRSMDNRTLFERDFQRAHWLTVLLINPLIGLAVGLFVGFFQKWRASVIAALCLVPQFAFHLYADTPAGGSGERFLTLLAHQCLVFLPAVVIAHYVWKLRNRREIRPH